ncbi:cystatin precursor [Podarcis lilfordi]|uniref:Cystatin n=2 Tax=Podarcis lilfordi TaxID=74358 RepID=A0AA35PU10_9SAUR|nr:cystatin precursor [Podarcis lilfordi]
MAALTSSSFSAMAQLCSPVAMCISSCLGLLLLFLPALFAGSIGMPGGLTPRSVSDPDVQKAAAFAVSAYNQASNNMFYCRQLSILKAESQVVEGMKYYLTVKLVNTLCEKKGGSNLSAEDLQRCSLPLEGEQQKQICEFQVWSRPWLSDTRLTHMSCRAASS